MAETLATQWSVGQSKPLFTDRREPKDGKKEKREYAQGGGLTGLGYKGTIDSRFHGNDV